MVYIIGSGPIEDKGNIKDTLDKDRDLFRLNGDQNGLYVTGIIIGEIQRDPKKDYSDENITKILKVLRKMTMKAIASTPDDPDNPNKDHLIVQMIDTYIPPPVSDVEVEAWLTSSYSDDMLRQMGKGAYRVIGEAKKYFDGREINSDVIKNIIDGVLNE